MVLMRSVEKEWERLGLSVPPVSHALIDLIHRFDQLGSPVAENVGIG